MPRLGKAECGHLLLINHLSWTFSSPLVIVATAADRVSCRADDARSWSGNVRSIVSFVLALYSSPTTRTSLSSAVPCGRFEKVCSKDVGARSENELDVGREK